jgi:PAS domain-containing protein
MRSDHAVQVATGAAPVLFRCEARPWRQKRDASVAGIVVICNKFVGAPTGEGAEVSGEAEAETSVQVSGAGRVEEAVSELDVSGAEVPVFVLDGEGRVVAANDRAGELSLARGIEEGRTALWDILEDEERRPAMKLQFEEYVSRMAGSEEGVPQILTVKSPTPGYADRSAGAMPSRWLVARQGGGGVRWLALGLSGLSPVVPTAKIGIHLPATTTGSSPFATVPPAVAATPSVDQAALEQLRQEIQNGLTSGEPVTWIPEATKDEARRHLQRSVESRQAVPRCKASVGNRKSRVLEHVLQHCRHT